MSELYFLSPAERFLRAQDDADRRHLIAACRALADDPFVDGQTKFYQTHLPQSMRVWTDFHFWALYEHDVGMNRVIVHEIGLEDEP